MKKEALEVLRNRRSIREYSTEKVKEELLDKVLEMGTYAPTGMGSQNPIIVSIEKEELLKKLDTMSARVMGREGLVNPYYGAPVIILVFAKKDSPYPETDSALIGGNIMNAAYAVGLGTCWINRGKQMFESEEGKKLQKDFGIDDTYGCYCTIALGVPKGNHPEAKARKKDYIRKIK
ncbi:MAG: nitroreductase family protein [Tissierellia bacterium]|nr:nitroreductase family protein [Tissierellia bacterium]